MPSSPSSELDFVNSFLKCKKLGYRGPADADEMQLYQYGTDEALLNRVPNWCKASVFFC